MEGRTGLNAGENRGWEVKGWEGGEEGEGEEGPKEGEGRQI